MNVHPHVVHPRALDYPESILPGVIPDESELTSGTSVEPGRRYGFFTDTTLCIGCKACEVACKEWNELPMDNFGLTGMSYDNTVDLSATTWRHVQFIEQMSNGDGQRAMLLDPYQSNWLMMSDICKHCANAPCLEACPTGAIFRTEFDTVVVQPDVCNGCGYCVPSCPFGVVALEAESGRAQKCTLCYDRLKGGLEPACAKACPTNSIQFGEITELIERAQDRVTFVEAQGLDNAYLYGVPDGPGATNELERLNCFFLLLDEPQIYNLPVAPQRPARHIKSSLLSGALAMAGFTVAAIVSLMSDR